MDGSVPANLSEQARLSAKRVIITVDRSFPDARRRQKVMKKKEYSLNPLDLACDSLLLKAKQIRRTMQNAGIQRGAYSYDKTSLKRLDLKQLQLFLQGAVSPSVNAGVLSYAEAFTSPSQKERYGEEGTRRLVTAFKTLTAELEVALRVNEAAMSNERSEYRAMLKSSYDGMLERLAAFFGEKFQSDPTVTENDVDSAQGVSNSNRGTTTAMHIFDSIGGIG